MRPVWWSESTGKSGGTSASLLLESSYTSMRLSDAGGYGGIGGGRGLPSATSVFMVADGGYGGIGGGNGLPSARRLRSIPVELPVELLTKVFDGSTIIKVKTQSARTNAVFFKGVASSRHHEQAQSWRGPRYKNVPSAEHFEIWERSHSSNRIAGFSRTLR